MTDVFSNFYVVRFFMIQCELKILLFEVFHLSLLFSLDLLFLLDHFWCWYCMKVIKRFLEYKHVGSGGGLSRFWAFQSIRLRGYVFWKSTYSPDETKNKNCSLTFYWLAVHFPGLCLVNGLLSSIWIDSPFLPPVFLLFLWLPAWLCSPRQSWWGLWRAVTYPCWQTCLTQWVQGLCAALCENSMAFALILE